MGARERIGMKLYVLTFHPNTCAYRCHAVGCAAATNQPKGRGHACRIAMGLEFASVQAAHDWADNDEYEKRSSDDVEREGLANFKACNCTKQLENSNAD